MFHPEQNSIQFWIIQENVKKKKKCVFPPTYHWFFPDKQEATPYSTFQTTLN